MALDPAETRKFKTKMQADLVAGKDSFPDLQKAAFSLVNGSTKLSSRTNQHLRHVEKDILIPKIMREKAKERCSEQVQGQINFCETLQMLDGFGRIFHRISQTKRRNLLICHCLAGPLETS
ncbi:COX assembly mitochondrial protein homolog isoform X4 [Papio anubis]|uniref:COX assembly mitochondrial protein homolog isoform X4 n=1 Tax=Papio anubis TaxID=9555 RepID=UPI0012AE5B02|nr:COX assembly mitochondrial protein homolog isoform X4 [Papio anubis]